MSNDDTVTEVPELPVLPDVVAAIAWVQAHVGGIAKAKRPRDPSSGDREFYAYRGIDQIAAAAQPLLGQAGVVIFPTEGKIVSVDDIEVGGRPWTRTTVTVLWTVYGPNDTKIESVVQGVGLDNSDKGYNKAMTQAFKNLLLRILCIGDPQDDADQPGQQNNAIDPRRAPAPPVDLDDPSRLFAVELFERIKNLTPEHRDVLKDWAKSLGAEARGFSVPALTVEPLWAADVASKIDSILAAAGIQPDEPLDEEIALRIADELNADHVGDPDEVVG